MAIRSTAAQLGIEVLVETGTYRGDMVYAMRRHFKRIFSIELSPELWAYSSRRLARYKHVQVLQGDSSKCLDEVVERISGPCLFWLDAHYSAGTTARGSEDSPVFAELKVVLSEKAMARAILIDDAREFQGVKGYPTVQQIEAYVRSIDPQRSVTVEHDMIRIIQRPEMQGRELEARD
jgi:hypothetical protein